MLFKTCTGLATEECLESSFFTHCSLVEPVICHLADAIQMDKSCHHNKDMEYLMALELREKRKNINVWKLVVTLIIFKVARGMVAWLRYLDLGLAGILLFTLSKIMHD